jgi:hypothetical protein
MVILFFALFLLTSGALYSQEDLTFTEQETISDRFYEASLASENSSSLFDYYESATIIRTEINSASLADLMRIPFLSYNAARLISDYRKSYGVIFSLRELYSIDNIDTTSLKLASPFFLINGKCFSCPDTSGLSKFNFLMRNSLSFDLQNRKGFIENKFEGDKIKSYQKISAQFRDKYSFTLVAAKDPGEKSYSDFSSFSFFMKNSGIINELVLGDYLLEFGQGLALWNCYGFYRSIDAAADTKRTEREIAPYSGANENQFFRGSAIQLKYKKFSVDLFYSYNKFDAGIDTASGLIVTRPVSGLHRTVTELLYKKNAYDKINGINLGFANEALNVGLLFYNSSLSAKLAPNSRNIPEKKNFNYTSFYYNFYSDIIDLFGETAYDGFSFAGINSLNFTANKNVSFLVSVRNYSGSYFNIHCSGFGKNSTSAQNETGVYWGAKINTEAGIFNINFDMYKFPQPIYNSVFPSSGSDFVFNFFSRKIFSVVVSARYILENSETSSADSQQKITKQNFKFQCSDITFGNTTLKEVFSYTDYKVKPNILREKGYAFIQDVTYRLNSLLSASARFALFSTDSYNTAIYEYEKEVPGTTSNPALYLKGERFFILLSYTPIPRLYFYLKYSETVKPLEKTLSSADNEILGNIDNRFSFQIDIKF